MAGDVVVAGPLLDQAEVCEPILRALPEWFGIEEANVQYVRDIGVLPAFLASVDGKVVGFLTLKRHNAFSAEIHVMGVHPAHHRQGVGRALICEAEAKRRVSAGQDAERVSSGGGVCADARVLSGGGVQTAARVPRSVGGGEPMPADDQGLGQRG